ncbi:MAG: hypothetical protein ACKO5E_17440 [bacterium]
MAIRLLLAASVFALSLPLPDRQSPNDIYQLVNSELSEILSTVRNEPVFETVASVSGPAADNSKEIENAALALPLAETPSPVALFPATEVELLKPAVEASQVIAEKKVESPIDLAFDVIQEQFASEASAFSLAEADHHVSRIPVATGNHDLPPAPAADDLKEHQADLHLAEISRTILVDAPVGAWAEADAIAADSPETLLGNLEMTKPESQEMTELEWLALTRLEPEATDELAFATEPAAEETARPETPELRKAVRLTLEAIAAWTNLAGRQVK